MKSVLAVAAVMLLAGSAFGSITMSTVAPTSDVVASQLLRDSSSDMIWRVDGHQYFGQTFTATSAGVTAISVLVAQEPSSDRMAAGMDFTMKLWDAAGNAAATSGTTIATAQGLTPDFAKATMQWMTFEIPAALNVGGIYGFTVDFTMQRESIAGDGGHKLGGDNPAGMQYVGGDLYTGGQGFRLVGDSLVNNLEGGSNTQDLGFIVQNVPEPATMSLLALGALGALIRRKK